MLIVTRRSGEGIRIQNQITVTILSVRGSQVRIGIVAPAQVTINRDEVHNRMPIKPITPLIVTPRDEDTSYVTNVETGEEVVVQRSIGQHIALLLSL